jgi:PAS domain S-box-containing protein
MGIRTRIFLIVFFAAIFVTTALFIAASLFILNNFQTLEREEIQDNLEQVLESLEKDFEYLQNTTADWAYWTDTYEFLQNRYPNYPAINLATTTLEALNLDLLVIVNSDLEPAAHLAIHPQLHVEIYPPDEVYQAINEGSLLPKSQDQPASGIVMTKQGPLIVSARYVLRNDQSGPPAGVLVFARYLNQPVVTGLSRSTKDSIKLYRCDSASLPEDVKSALPALRSGQKAVVQIISDESQDPSERIAAYTLLEDIHGEPALIFRVDADRSTYRHSKITVRLFGILLAWCCLFIGLAVFISLDRQINKRVLALHRDVNLIRKTQDFSLRVSANGNDEISSLAAEINRMLADLNQYRLELEKSTSQFREVLQNLQLAAVILDTNGLVTFCNDYFLKLTGWKRKDVLQKYWFDLFAPPELFEEYRELFAKILQGHVSTAHIETYIAIRRGERRLIAWNNTNLRDVNGNLVGIARIGEDITERRDAEEKLRRSFAETRLHLSRLTALRQIDTAITSDQHVQEKIQSILTTIQDSLNVDAVNILLVEEHHNTVTSAGKQGGLLDQYKFERLDGMDLFLNQLSRKSRPVVVTNLLHEKPPRWLQRRLPDHPAYTVYAAAPLKASGNLIGVLEIFSTKDNLLDQDWLSHFQTLALQTAIAIDSVTMVQHIKDARNELAEAYEATLIGWAKALELHDKETRGHSDRMIELVERLGRRLGLDETALSNLKRGTLLHDIGKMGVPDSILQKPEPLDESEWATMRQHPQFAYDLLCMIPYLTGAMEVPYCHHERWDGTGYPRGLRGEEIPLNARIFSVIDVWDALTHDRPYRPAWSKEKALEYIQAQAGIQFDPQVAQQFVAMLTEEEASFNPEVKAG